VHRRSQECIGGHVRINTYTGPIEAEALGATLMHEHVFTVSPELAANYPSAIDWDENEAVELAVEKMNRLKASGIDTIVDLTVLGIGRQPRLVARVAERSPVHIVAATGLYVLKEIPRYFRLRGATALVMEEEPLVGMFVHDIVEGIEGVGVKAAMLKCAIDRDGMTPDVERVLRAVGRAQRETGVPVTVHTHARRRTGLLALAVLVEEGVHPSQVIVGHSGDSEDLDYLNELLETGAYLGMDRFGLDVFLPVDRRVAVVAKLCADGWAHRLLLSHDAQCHNDSAPRAHIAAAFPNHDYLYLPTQVFGMLRASGVEEQTLHQMMVDNPREVLDCELTA
jgi:phosphotriesterase-related protein